MYFPVYNRHGYIEIVSWLAQHSMQAAVEEVHNLPNYPSKGEVGNIVMNKFSCHFPIQQWIITDARHDSTANAYHTTVHAFLEGNENYYYN